MLRTAAGARQQARVTIERLAHVRAFATRLVEAGAVMILAHGHPRRQEVTKLAWRGPHAVAWVDGSKRHDAHRLTFDDLRGVTKHGVYFMRDSHVVGYLLSAASAEPKPHNGAFHVNGNVPGLAMHTVRSQRE